MPHMANLSWIILFCIFNAAVLLMLMSLKTPTIHLKNQDNLHNKSNNTKWQW